MNIGIFGDSFSFDYKDSKGSKFLWCNLLAKKLNAELENHSFPGSSVYYSYDKFIKNYKKYDLCIFLVTHPNRYHSLVKINGIDKVVANIAHIEYLLQNQNMNPMDKQKLNDIKGWFIASDEEHQLTMNNLMIKDMLCIDKNIIIYPCFVNSMSKELYSQLNLNNVKPLFELLDLQLTKLGLPPQAVDKENPDYTAGHLVEPFNNFIADMMYSKIINKKDTFDYVGLDDIVIDKTITYYNL